MAEYFQYQNPSNVAFGQNLLLADEIPCNRGYVVHRNGSGILTLRGCVNGNGCFARYQVAFNANIAVPSDGTVGPISVALAIDGEPIQTSKAIFTPAAVAENPPTDNNFGNVTSTAIITVPRGCCTTIAVENTSEGLTAADPSPAILVKNANLTVTRIA